MVDPTESIISILAKKYAHESLRTSHLRERAASIIKEMPEDVSQLPETVSELLASVIKPLFAVTRHPSVTSSGRKVLVSEPPTVGRIFYSDDEEQNQNPWKTLWTGDLMTYILTSYDQISLETDLLKAMEAHFHLLAPTILKILDARESVWKITACRLLRHLCSVTTRCKSDIFEKRGFDGIFIDALKPLFNMLPHLTTEDESLPIIKEVYPTFRALIEARYCMMTEAPLLKSESNSTSSGPTLIKHRPEVQTSTAPAVQKPTKRASIRKPAVSDASQRQSRLSLVFRDAVLASLNHLSVGSGTDSVQLSIVLLSQIRPFVTDMGCHTSKHLQRLLPFLRNVLCDPFGHSLPEILMEALDALQAVAEACPDRVRDKWWAECLRSLVGCWCVVLDERKATCDRMRTSSRSITIARITQHTAVLTKITEVVKYLEGLIGVKEFVFIKEWILREEPKDLVAMFDGLNENEDDLRSITEPEEIEQKELVSEIQVK